MRPKCRYLPAALRGNNDFVERKRAYRGGNAAPGEAGTQCVQKSSTQCATNGTIFF